jgi:hydrogenase-4 component F
VASALFVLAAVIMTGSPPFGLFFSEMTILRRLAGRTAAITVFLACLVLLFCASSTRSAAWRWDKGRAPARIPDAERFDVDPDHAAGRRAWR